MDILGTTRLITPSIILAINILLEGIFLVSVATGKGAANALLPGIFSPILAMISIVYIRKVIQQKTKATRMFNLLNVLFIIVPIAQALTVIYLMIGVGQYK